jgi:indolepyruvate ferredoxin oxidoreductase, beta subunit
MSKKTLKKEPLNLIISGVGGQGNVLLSALIGKVLLDEGFKASVADTYGVTQRGGSVTSHIKISTKKVYSSVTLDGHADVILGMEPVEALRNLGIYGNPGVLTIVNPRPVYPIGGVPYPDLEDVKKAIIKLSAKTKFVNATDEALKMGNPIFTNVILLGALVGSGFLPLDEKSTIPVLEERFPGKLLEPNIQAFKRGMELIAQA